ncbi:peptide chain release factor N(5)-glutamine methyltransferase [Novosphingobium sp. FSY-8]|uniref:Release factor glutamine methyltransferase n=1 Tax=Novosphingobium ovatum TaxID=1908523 RepID=A0ABW9XF54_9SPHN|nr:peptide chain release factor N(5)-glutamine methyltransferase [Novosphingobium ovatum]NBC37067.1 peptide chain release factor N(5)-glutamine methyltransferase [Novosphingobium ovatum]
MNEGAPQTVAQAIARAAGLLALTSDTARLDAEVLMAHALGCGRSDLLLRRMGDAAPACFADMVQRRAAHTPVAHITGEQDFYGLPFRVTPDTLIPRGDSETLIDLAQQVFAAGAGRVLDLGTGTGCLLLTMLHLWPDARGVGIERSAPARGVAQGNAGALDLAARADIRDGDWTQDGWADGLGQFDLILSNPPYVETGADLARSVRDHEPASALFAGADGLDDYRVLIPQLPGLLAPGGVAIVEIGHQQGEAVAAIGAESGFAPSVHADLAGRARAVMLRPR